jgi:hypothetical protein
MVVGLIGEEGSFVDVVDDGRLEIVVPGRPFGADRLPLGGGVQSRSVGCSDSQRVNSRWRCGSIAPGPHTCRLVFGAA